MMVKIETLAGMEEFKGMDAAALSVKLEAVKALSGHIPIIASKTAL